MGGIAILQIMSLLHFVAAVLLSVYEIVGGFEGVGGGFVIGIKPLDKGLVYWVKVVVVEVGIFVEVGELDE